jgi:hypothetical protein
LIFAAARERVADRGLEMLLSDWNKSREVLGGIIETETMRKGAR